MVRKDGLPSLTLNVSSSGRGQATLPNHEISLLEFLDRLQSNHVGIDVLRYAHESSKIKSPLLAASGGKTS